MKPILFNTEMVKALLDGRKTVTRRPLKGDAREHIQIDVDNSVIGVYDMFEGTVRPVLDYAPYRTGDILYVRETFVKADDGYHYRADATPDSEQLRKDYGYKYRPSIHMPKEAARIFLRVTDVRVERLQDITEDQTIKEGVPDDWPMDKVYCPICKGDGLIGAVHPVSLGFMEVECPHCEKGTSRFQNLWNSTIKPADLPLYGWDASPWVWVIEFEKISKEDAYNA